MITSATFPGPASAAFVTATTDPLPTAILLVDRCPGHTGTTATAVSLALRRRVRVGRTMLCCLGLTHHGKNGWQRRPLNKWSVCPFHSILFIPVYPSQIHFLPSTIPFPAACFLSSRSTPLATLLCRPDSPSTSFQLESLMALTRYSTICAALHMPSIGFWEASRRAVAGASTESTGCFMPADGERTVILAWGRSCFSLLGLQIQPLLTHMADALSGGARMSSSSLQLLRSGQLALNPCRRH